MASVERFGQSVADIDSVGAKRLARVFFVDGLLRGAALTDPIVPPHNSPHPEHSDAKLDAHRIAEAEDGRSSLVTALYSTDGSFRAAPTIDPRDPEYKPFSATFSLVQTPIPFAYKQTLQVPGNATKKDVWAIQSVEIQETIGIYSVQFAYPFFDGSISRILREQNNKLHLIEGKYYRFTVGNVTPVEKNLWTYEYSWRGDDGTRRFTGALSGVAVLPPANKTWQGEQYVRPPFHGLVAVPDAADPTVQPEFREFLSFEIDDDGYESLPGYPFF